MYLYQAYGIGIHSRLQLFNLPISSTVKKDVLIDIDAIDLADNVDDNIFPYEKLTSQEAIFSIDGAGRFRVSYGNTITVDPAPVCDWLQVKRYLLGPAMAMLLYQRNRLVLHGCAIDMNGIAVAFLGDSGAGKSSIAASFLAKGHHLLVDDVVSVDIVGGNAWVDSGFPFIKISKEVSNLIPDVGKWELMDRVDNKVSYRLDHNKIKKGRARLRHIYIIMPGADFGLMQFNSQRALFELMRYSIPVRMVKLNHVQQFKRCVELVNCVRVYGIRRSESIHHLPDLVEIVEEKIGKSKMTGD